MEHNPTPHPHLVGQSPQTFQPSSGTTWQRPVLCLPGRICVEVPAEPPNVVSICCGQMSTVLGVWEIAICSYGSVTPTAHFEVVEVRFVLLLPETLFNRPAGVSHIQRPFQRNTGRCVRNEELQFFCMRITCSDQPVGAGRQLVTPYEAISELIQKPSQGTPQRADLIDIHAPAPARNTILVFGRTYLSAPIDRLSLLCAVLFVSGRIWVSAPFL